MSTLAELSEAQVDWLAAIPDLAPDWDLSDPYRPWTPEEVRVEVRARATPEALECLSVELAERWLLAKNYYRPDRDESGDISGEARRSFTELFMRELHTFLCTADGKYRRERAELLAKYKTGQTTFVAGVTASIAPYLGTTTSPFLIAAAAVALTVIGQVGLRAWCAKHSNPHAQTDRSRDS